MEWLSDMNVSSITSNNEKNDLQIITDDFILSYLRSPFIYDINNKITIGNEILKKYNIGSISNIHFKFTSNPTDFPITFIILNFTPPSDTSTSDTYRITFSYDNLNGPSETFIEHAYINTLVFRIIRKRMMLIYKF